MDVTANKKNIKISLMALLVAIMVVIGMFVFAENAYADIASGDWWKITDSGELIIGNGSEMTIPINPTNLYDWPWNSYRSQIISARFDGVVHAGTSTRDMFYICSKLTDLDLSSFDTSAVTNMQSMFGGCSGLTSLDLSTFDTSNVTDMSWMFNYCSKLTNLDLSQ